MQPVHLWDDIPVPIQGINRRLAATNMIAPASWAVDEQGRLLFVLELSGDHRNTYKQNVVQVHGLDVDLRLADEGGQLLVLSLNGEHHRDLFQVLCSSLLAELIDATSAASALQITLNHLKRWKIFFSGKKARILSLEEVRGLFAELWFLRELLHSKMGANVAVGSWYGPERIQQDFIFNDSAVEVKSLVASDPRTVRISSENQLDSVHSALYLLIVRLSASQADGCQSLNEIVVKIKSLVGDSDAAITFEKKLAEFGYLPLIEYDQPKFEVLGTQSYKVGEGFPRITRVDLASGVIQVRYQIQLEHLQPFRCDYDTMLRSTS